MKNILLLQTGGTIAMEIDESAYDDNNGWSDVLSREIPELSTLANIEVKELFLEDSSNINHHQWSRLSGEIILNYNQYDGFVILHGTDTMAYTASALSFCLQGLDKPVVLTGSQLPIAQLRSDARRNLINAIEMATLPIPEVCICFNDHLFRGNRSTKMSIGDFDAFASPNFPVLAEIGIHIERKHQPLPNTRQQFKTDCFCDDIVVLKIHPNLKDSFLRCIDLSKTRLVILETFGSGNFPLKGDYNLLPFLEACKEKDVLMLIASQAPYDSVDLKKYESGRAAKKLGAISARDMTIETCITKAMFLLNQHSEAGTITSLLNKNIAGEITII